MQLNFSQTPRLVEGIFKLPLREILDALGKSELYGNPVRGLFELGISAVDGHTFVSPGNLERYIGAVFTAWDESTNTAYYTIN